MLGKRTRSGIANSHVWISLLALCVTFTGRSAEPLEVIPVTGQPLAANVTRLLKALEFLGTPLPQTSVAALEPHRLPRATAREQPRSSAAEECRETRGLSADVSDSRPVAGR